jgi:hypothetical protein
MIVAAHIAFDSLPFLLAGAFPFRLVLRGGSLIRALLICWFLLVFWFLLFGFVLPLLASQLDRELGRAVSGWAPDGTDVGAMLVMGWFPAAIVVFIAAAFRRIAQRGRAPRQTAEPAARGHAG